VILGSIYASDLRRDLIARIQAGNDNAALRLLLAALPAELPPSVKKAARNEVIRELWVRLAVALPGARASRLARIVAEAGCRIEAGRRIDGRIFDSLQKMELADLEQSIRKALDYAPPRAAHPRWPCARQILNIAADLTAKF
jgi:hypothetical protein